MVIIKTCSLVVFQFSIKKAPSWELRCFSQLRKLKCITKTIRNTIERYFLFKEG